MQILLVEPNRQLGKSYQDYLEKSGNVVVVCEDGQSAIKASDSLAPDLVILELQLVGHSGIEFLYEFRSYPEWQTIPVVVHSLMPQSELDKHKIVLSQLGVQDYLYKPLTTLKQLGRAVGKYAVTKS